MIAAPDDAAEEAERTAWLETCSPFDIALLLGYVAGWDPGTFDKARAYVERVRAGASA